MDKCVFLFEKYVEIFTSKIEFHKYENQKSRYKFTAWNFFFQTFLPIIYELGSAVHELPDFIHERKKRVLKFNTIESEKTNLDKCGSEKMKRNEILKLQNSGKTIEISKKR